ncbi:hypothetical protein ACFL59_06855 [Planctomycetota bacterium]
MRAAVKRSADADSELLYDVSTTIQRGPIVKVEGGYDIALSVDLEVAKTRSYRLDLVFKARVERAVLECTATWTGPMSSDRSRSAIEQSVSGE